MPEALAGDAAGQGAGPLVASDCGFKAALAWAAIHGVTDWVILEESAKFTSQNHHYNTHSGLVTPYGDRDLGQHWLK